MTAKTLGELAALVGGTCIGDTSQLIHQVVHPAKAHKPEDLALILDPAIVGLLTQKPVTSALVPEELSLPEIPNQIKVKRPKVALAKLLDVFEKQAYVAPGIHSSAIIDPSATIEEGVCIGPLCTIGPNTLIGKNSRLIANVNIGANTVVGENCLFHPGAYVGDYVQIGNQVILQGNACVGSDGFSYVTSEIGSVEAARATGQVSAQNTQILRINSVGTVVLEDEVEIGACTCVDRATLGETRIKKGTKIDNLVQVAHNVTIGENCLIAAQAGIAGSTQIGDRVVIAGQAGFADHIRIEDDCVIIAQSGVMSNTPPKSILMGAPALPRRDFLQKEMNIKRIKGLADKLNNLSKKIEEMESELHRQSREKTEQPV